ncbi:MAG: glycosyltransferase family 4 protein [Chitinophagaceae bacterium]|nr:MAG: glycosyltransferase family 4 protein [Chitinophagaceae bacterium]
MKILLTADPEIPVPPVLYGGIERIVDILVQEYVKQGHEVSLFAHSDSQVPCRLLSWKAKRSGGISNTMMNAFQLWRHLLKEEYDVVHSFSRLGYLTPVLSSPILKVMSYQREPTIAQIQRAAKISRKGSLFFTGCSDYITNKIKPFAEAATVYNCVPIDKYQFCTAVCKDAPLVFLGRIEPVKGTHLAVEVAQRTGRQLIIAGNIPAEGIAYFDEKIKPFLTDRISYIGPVNDLQKNDLLGSASAFLMPIQWNEPFGIVMAEAMACGTPILGFPYGSVPEVVDDGITGFVCKDVNEMIAAVDKINQIDRRIVRNKAEKEYSGQTIAEKYLRLYTARIQNSKSYGAAVG